MKPRSLITVILGALIIIFGIFLTAKIGCVIPIFIGAGLCYLGWFGGRTATIVLGHIFVVVASYLITWGLYMLPYCKPTPAYIFGRPLFWGFISLFGGICTIYHGFCGCFRRNK